MAKKSKSEPKIEWREPPPKNIPQSSKYDGLRDALRRRQGVWALIRPAVPEEHRQRPHAFAASCRGSKLWDGFEVVARGREVFARYVGEAKR